MLLRGSFVTLIVGLVSVVAVDAQTPPPAPPSTPGRVELVGCVSDDPGTSGAFTFSDAKSGGKYRLTGKSVRKYAGQMVRVMGGPRGRGLSIRGGLWPSPNVAAQAGAMDPAQESIARQPGGGSSGTGGFDLPELRVVSVRGIEGSCR
jgi:hypothetical protein